VNILVLNGSPAGENSITLQTVLYMEKLCKKVSFSYRSIRGRLSDCVSDARKTAPEKLKTVIRHPIRKAE